MTHSTIEHIHREKTGKVSDKWTSYLAVYDELLKAYRTQAISLLEIGVQNGGSLETWSRYFSQAKVLIGCDINERCRQLEYDDKRVKVVVGDANQLATHQEIVSISNEFDIIIDDGSHISKDILNSFCLYFPLLRPGGLYVIEDTHTLYKQAWGGGILNDNSAYQFFKKIIDVINLQFWGNELPLELYFSSFFHKDNMPAFIKQGWIESIEFRNSMVVIRKSLEAGNQKLGQRMVTGTMAQVTDAPLKVKTASPAQ